MSSTNRIHSQIPSTPTPLSKSPNNLINTPQLKPGSTLTLLTIGHVKLHYVGGIDGKPGQFAGLEILGEQEATKYGKNNGGVEGKQYFQLENAKEKAGLFMPWRKFVDLIENGSVVTGETEFKKPVTIHETTSRRSSPFTAPKRTVSGGISHSMTPKLDQLETRDRRDSIASQASSKGPIKSSPTTIITRSGLTPFSQSSPSSTQPSSNLEKELKKLSTSKEIIETERNNLAQQTDDLKSQIAQLQARLTANESLIIELQTQTSDSLDLVKAADERVLHSETRLAHQKKLFEEQRTELFDVIDQVEKQVSENEELYLGELKKLKEELEQRIHILDNLQQEKIELEEQLKLSKISNGEVANLGNENLGELKNTIATQTIAILDLTAEIKEKTATIEKISEESLELKQGYLAEKERLTTENEKIKQQLTDRDQRIQELESQVLELYSKIELLVRDKSRNMEDSEKKRYESEIEGLTLKVKEMEINNNSEDNKAKNKDLLKAQDTIQELEFKLESKEGIIADLKKELTTISTAESNDNHLKKMEEDLSISTKENLQLKSELENLRAFKTKTLDESKEVLLTKDTQISELLTKLSIQEQETAETSEKLKSLKTTYDELSLKSENHDDILLKVKQFDTKYLELEKERDQLLKKVEALESTAKNSDEEVTTKIEEMKFQYDELIKTKDDKVNSLESTNSELLAQIQSLESAASDKSTGNKDSVAQLAEMKKHNEELDQLLEEMTLELDLLKEESIQREKHSNASTSSEEKVKELKKQLEDLKSQHQQELASLEEQFTTEVNTLQEKLAISTLTNNIDSPKGIQTITPSSDIDINSFRTYTPKSAITASSPVHSLNSTHTSSIISNNRFSTLSTLSLRPPVISQVVDGELQVYTPPKLELENSKKTERRLWCGLCERDGHDSVDCPYEIDIDVF